MNVWKTLLLAAAGLTLASGLSAQQRVALVGGMLIDGYERPPIHHAAVLIEGNRIVAVGAADDVEIPRGTRVIDTSGRTMLPGLIDAHAHLDLVGHGDYDRWYEFVAETDRIQEVMEITSRQLIDAGVTTALDLGAPLDIVKFRERVRRGEITGPRIYTSGPWITRVRLAGVPDELQNVVASPEEAAAKAHELLDAGVDVIKTWVGLTQDDFNAIVEAAHSRRARVHAHLYEPEAIRKAIDAGVDVLQHVGSGGNPPYEEALVAEIAHKGIPVVQTISHRIWVYPATLAFPERLQDPRLQASFPPDMYEELQRSFVDFERLGYFRTTPRQIRNSKVAARQLIEANVVMAMGTDAASPLNFHTEAAWREISALVDSGMSPLRAISAATKTGAEILGLGRDLGTIEAGKLADVIVVSGNPLFDINALANVEVVVKDGRVLKGGNP